ncbi:MAG: RDD family protein [Thermodesulfobacteriota bacterium]|nr:RDD family protein [Thermodesulfobacteriota bacterium]
MIVFRSVNCIALGFFGPLFYVIPLVIYGIVKIRTRNKPLPEGFASFERRALAFVIDFALIEGLALGIELIFATMADPPTFWGGVLVLGFGLFNLVMLPAKRGWSLGKRALSIKIVKKNEKPGVYDMLYREIIKSWFSLSVFFLGCFWMLIGKGQLTWHDSVADTRVLNIGWNQADNSLVVPS